MRWIEERVFKDYVTKWNNYKVIWDIETHVKMKMI
jgi:hypothetical protein